MNHRVEQNQKRTVEALAGFAYPSNPSQALSTILLDKISAISFKVDIESYPAGLGHVILSLWSQCLEETYVGAKTIFHEF